MTRVSCFEKNQENAYLTVEATLVMVVVMPVIFFVMSWMIYSYNRCLLEQDLEVLALRETIKKGSKEELLNDIKIQVNSLEQDRYVALKRKEMNVKFEGNKVFLSQSATMPLWGGNIFKIGKVWDIKATCTDCRLEEISFLRACRKVKQGKEK